VLFAARLARRFVALIAGVAALVAMWTFTDKPYIWEWMGRPDEIYPEVAFLVFGLPAALVSVVSGGWIVWAARPSARASWTLTIARVTNGIALAICLWLSWFALSAFLNRG
jgi:hypothetical protein